MNEMECRRRGVVSAEHGGWQWRRQVLAELGGRW
jgi:hypothetical protein